MSSYNSFFSEPFYIFNCFLFSPSEGKISRMGRKGKSILLIFGSLRVWEAWDQPCVWTRSDGECCMLLGLEIAETLGTLIWNSVLPSSSSLPGPVLVSIAPYSLEHSLAHRMKTRSLTPRHNLQINYTPALDNPTFPRPWTWSFYLNRCSPSYSFLIDHTQFNAASSQRSFPGVSSVKSIVSLLLYILHFPFHLIVI